MLRSSQRSLQPEDQPGGEDGAADDMDAGVGDKSDDLAEEREQQADLPGEQERRSQRATAPARRDMTDQLPGRGRAKLATPPGEARRRGSS